MKKFHKNKRFQIFVYFSICYLIQKILYFLFQIIDVRGSIIIKEYHLHHVFWGVCLMIISTYLMILFFDKIKRIPWFLLLTYCWGLAWVIDEIWMIITFITIYPIWLNIVPAIIFAILLFTISLF